MLHIRHPAQALKSWWFHLLKLSEDRSKDTIYFRRLDTHFVAGVPSSNPSDHSLDEFVTYWFPRYIEWANGWLRYAKHINSNQLLISTYEDFVSNPQEAIYNIGSFFGLKLSAGDSPEDIILPSKSEGFHFREGSTNNYVDFFEPKLLNFMFNNMKGEISKYYRIG